jgi:prophage antirepressor-like protein
MSATFNFVEKSVRVEMDENNNPLFCAKDVCDILCLNNISQALSRLDDDEKRDIILNDVTGRKQEMAVINESGLYTLILSSRKPEAKVFKRWVTSEVLPAIRKTGSYTNPNHQAQPPEHTAEKINRQQLDQIESLVHQISICCHHKTVASWNVYAGIRETYGLKNGVQELPAVHFNAVYGFLNLLNEKAMQYLTMRVAVDKQFCKQVLRKRQLQLDFTQQMLLPSA